MEQVPTTRRDRPERPDAGRFGDTARRLAAAARAAGLVVPAFRSPPRDAAAVRTIRRLPGGPVVAVRLRARPFADVVVDMVDGVLVANSLEGASATRVRTALLEALGVKPSGVPLARTPRARVA